MSTEQSKLIDPNSPDKLAKILLQMGAAEEGQRASAAARAVELLKRRPDMAKEIAESLPRMVGGSGGLSYAEMEQKLNEALNANAAYETQNAAIREENDRLRTPPPPSLGDRMRSAFAAATSGLSEETREKLGLAAIITNYFVLGPLGHIPHRVLFPEEHRGEWSTNGQFCSGLAFFVPTLMAATFWVVAGMVDYGIVSNFPINNRIDAAAQTIPVCSKPESKSKEADVNCGKAVVSGPFKSPLFGLHWTDGPLIVKKSAHVSAFDGAVAGGIACVSEKTEVFRPPTSSEIAEGKKDWQLYSSRAPEPKCGPQ